MNYPGFVSTFILLLTSVDGALLSGSPIISTTSGLLRGEVTRFSSRFLTQYGNVYGFRGIPYAKPPVGERRFRPPEPADVWEGVYNATMIPPSCAQPPPPFFLEFLTGGVISEDCLYLNVFVPDTAPQNATVMVFIHGGSFAIGSGSANIYQPSALTILGEVILVTINYRLNIFGFLSTGDDAIPPNLALQDQRLALQWINENIAAFGGDPTKVTLFGESAGGVCVGWHILSAESRQYIQRAILQSGNSLSPFGYILTREMAKERATIIADMAKCDLDGTDDTSIIASCLREKTTDELLALHEEAIASDIVDLWGATIDGYFLANDILSLLEEGSYGDIDILTGTNEDEGTFLSYFETGFTAERPFINKNLFANLTNSKGPLISDLLEVIYSESIDESGNYEGALSDILGDTVFTCSTTGFARYAATAGSVVYMYRMTQVPSTSLWGVPWFRAAHAEELQYVFGIPFYDDYLSYGATYDELKVAFNIIRMWTNFAKSGNPNLPLPLVSSISEWPQFTLETQQYKELDINFSNNQRLRQHYCNFWDNLYAQIIDLQSCADSGN